MRVRLLGPLRVVSDGGSVPVGGVRLRALLARLALEADRPVGTRALRSAVWPEDEDDPGHRHALQSLVSRLRRTLPADVPLRREPGGYRLGVPRDAVDAHHFTVLAHRGGRALREGRPDEAATALRTALALWEGEALADVPVTGFTASAVARLEEQRLTAVEDRVEADLVRDPHGPPPSHRGELLAELTEFTASRPYRERPHGLLMRALCADGRPAEALDHYERFRADLADRLGTDPSEELRRIHLAVLRDRPGTPPAPPTPPASPPPHTGPTAVPPRVALTRLIGRERELAALDARWRAGRLVTLVGTGGVGKTRLALAHVAQSAAGTGTAAGAGTASGIGRTVELASVAAPEDVPAAVLAATGGAVGAGGAADTGGALVERLVEALSPADTLLVLDNCEHVVETVARLAEELLGRCPRLRVLATSREPLGIPGESLLPVPPLECPPPGSSSGTVRDSPAVRLFADRATAVRPDFALTGTDAATVAALCRRLDGLPLALELAAAHVRLLSVGQLAARLDDRFALLTGGSRTALPRHRTLRAVVAWSWDLLDEEARTLASYLAVFPASFTLDAAEGVAPENVPVLAGIATLVDKSLLQPAHPTDGHDARYRMLETVRAYGREQLAERGLTEVARTAHARHFLRTAERAEPALRGPRQLLWLRRLTADREHLVAALRFALARKDAVTAVHLAAATGYFWTLTGEHGLATDLLGDALSLPYDERHTDRNDGRHTAVALCLLNGVLAGRVAEVRALWERLRDGLPTAPPTAHPTAPLVGPLAALVTGEPERGLNTTAAREPAPWTRGMLHLVRSFLHSNSGAGSGAETCGELRSAAVEFRAAGDDWGLATALTHAAFALTALGEHGAAVTALEEAMGPAGRLGGTGLQQVWRATARARTGETEAAREELLDVATGTSSPRHACMARLALADLARQAADLPEAERQYELAEQAGTRYAPHAEDTEHAQHTEDRAAHDDVALRTLHRSGTGRLAVAKGDAAGARRALRAALEGSVAAWDMTLVAETAVGVAQLQCLRGAFPSASRLLGAAHALRGAPDTGNPDVSGLARALISELGPAAHEDAYEDGRALTAAEAVTAVGDALARADAPDRAAAPLPTPPPAAGPGTPSRR